MADKKPRKPRKKGTRKRVRSKSTKATKGGKNKKAPAAKPVGAIWYQKLRSEVIAFYKQEYETTKLDKGFITARTRYAFEYLNKTAPVGGVTKTFFKRFVVNLDQILTKPSITVLEKDNFIGGEKGIEYWELENYFNDNRQDLKKYKEIVVDCSNIIPGLIETGSAPEEINCQSIFKEIRNHFYRINKAKKLQESDILWFAIFKSKNGVQIVFELVDNQPDEVIKPEGATGAPGGEDEEEDIEEPTTTTKKTTPPAEAPEVLPPTRTAIKEEERAAEIHTIEKLERKKNSYRKDIKFNSKEIDKMAKLVNLYKGMGINTESEMARLKKLKDTNENLFGKIDVINEQLDKI